MRTDMEILLAVQKGIPTTREPFAEAAEALGMTQEKLVDRINGMKEDGTIRRFGPNINQRRIGITANAVVVWRVPDAEVHLAVERMIESPEISHCYERATAPMKWEYNLYTVVHGYDRKSVDGFVRGLSEEIGVKDYVVLYSKRRFKGTSSRISE